MFDRFKTRSRESERLDRGDYTEVEYKYWQKEMWYIHRVFGEVRALRKSVIGEITALGNQKVSVLDIAAGSGELLNYIKENSRGAEIFGVGIEASSDGARMIGSQGIAAVRCDALDLPFASNSFDFVYCTLFLHHLNESQAAQVIGQMARVARLKFFVIDLNRNPIAYFAYRALGSILLQRFTRDDGSLSILRSYRCNELRRLALEAGAKNIQIRRSAINRLIMSATG
jgi:SAM-dependent methyltransferase